MQRPRLRPEVIACDECGSEKVGYYPRSRQVRAKVVHTFCSSACQRRHWARRRRQVRSANVEWKCHGPGCDALLTYTLESGRPSDYCSDRCKQRARRERERRQPGGAVLRARQALQAAQYQVDVATQALGGGGHAPETLRGQLQAKHRQQERDTAAYLREQQPSHDPRAFVDLVAYAQPEKRRARAAGDARAGGAP